MAGLAERTTMTTAAGGDTREGLLLTGSAFALWGLYPFYFKALAAVPALEIVLHRIVWSSLLLAIVIQARGGWHEVVGALRDPGLRRGLIATTVLIAANWFAYVVAVTGDQVLDASLGYFLCPLVSVALGVLVLKERLTKGQVAAVALAGLAVLMLIVKLGIVPRMALFLAISFGLYGLLKKRLPVSPLVALFLECALLLPPAAALAVWLWLEHGLVGPTAEPFTFVLLLLAGVITVVPLLLFGLGARRIRLSTVGLLQYIAPTMLFFEGVLWFGEPLNPWRLAAFVLIWAALALYTGDGWLRARRAA
ncbi:EamA family transporter RarD [Benzoatithermus flavus]|uniref:EamA family transporter RarD n=1 Tax=Benzoatithermus flavus TaxID=3108223 RepID=A0ABU8XMI7_9PROT